MKLLFIADGRSPISQNWIKYFVESKEEVHLISTYPCTPAFEFASFNIIPVAFSRFTGSMHQGSITEPADIMKNNRRNWLRRLVPIRSRTWFRQRFGPLTLSSAAKRLLMQIDSIKPDLIHAMRIPFEGMLASVALQDCPNIPLLISVWGNDFTFHATANKKMSSYTRLTMERANALHTDTFRDQVNAYEWGFHKHNPMIVQPCAGGVDMDIFHPDPLMRENGTFTIINPRGMRAYVRNDTFFRSIPLVLHKNQEIDFICPAMEGETEAETWLKTLDIADRVTLLPRQSISEMADLYKRSKITLSITTHDGTPNSLLEAMACGCFPIVGDIDSIREWISQNENGILVDPKDPLALAEAILKAVRDEDLRSKAYLENIELVKVRAEYHRRMAETREFYRSIIS